MEKNDKWLTLIILIGFLAVFGRDFCHLVKSYLQTNPLMGQELILTDWKIADLNLNTSAITIQLFPEKGRTIILPGYFDGLEPYSDKTKAEIYQSGWDNTLRVSITGSYFDLEKRFIYQLAKQGVDVTIAKKIFKKNAEFTGRPWLIVYPTPTPLPSEVLDASINVWPP